MDIDEGEKNPSLQHRPDHQQSHRQNFPKLRKDTPIQIINTKITEHMKQTRPQRKLLMAYHKTVGIHNDESVLKDTRGKKRLLMI